MNFNNSRINKLTESNNSELTLVHFSFLADAENELRFHVLWVGDHFHKFCRVLSTVYTRFCWVGRREMTKANLLAAQPQAKMNLLYDIMT